MTLEEQLKSHGFVHVCVETYAKSNKNLLVEVFMPRGMLCISEKGYIIGSESIDITSVEQIKAVLRKYDIDDSWI